MQTQKRFRVDAASENTAWRKAGMEKVGDGMQYGVALLAFALPVMVLLHRQQKEKEHKRKNSNRCSRTILRS